MDKLEDLKKKIFSQNEVKGRRREEFFEVQKKPFDGARKHWSEEISDESKDGTKRDGIGSFRISIPAGEKKRVGQTSPGAGVLKTKNPFYKSKIFILILFLMAISVSSAVLVYFGVFTKGGDMVVEILGDFEAEAGEIKKWTVVVKNNFGVMVKNGELNFIYPKDSVPLDAGEDIKKSLRSKIRMDEMRPDEERRFDFSARLLGSVGEEKSAVVSFLYQPSNVSSRLQKEAVFITKISRVPLAVLFDLPEKIVSGQEVKFTVDVSTVSGFEFNDLYLRIDWPAGFEFLSSDIKPDYSNNIWKLGKLPQGTSKRISINSRIVGFPEELKVLVSGIGEYNPQTRQFKIYYEKTGEIKIASSPLFVRQEINRSENYVARFGETISFSVYYKNNLTVPVRDVYIKAKLSEELLDLKNLRVEKGFFDGGTRELVWNAASNPDLKEIGPGKQGVVIFSTVIKKQPVISGFSDKNFIVSSVVKIGTKTPPEEYEGAELEYDNLLEVKLETQLNVYAKAIFYDSPLGPNVGSLPPRLGKETSYTIVFQVANLSNDLRGVKLYASLPGHVKWLDQLTGDRKDKIGYNSSSGELVWDVGDVLAGTGVIRPRLFLAFNVSINPGEDVLNKRVILVRDIKISGVDSFTKTLLEGFVGELTSELKDDLRTTTKDWNVVE